MSIREKLMGILWTLGITSFRPDPTIHRSVPTALELQAISHEEKKELDAMFRRRQDRLGLVEFEIDGVKIWARDFKNAQRKAKNEMTRLLARSKFPEVSLAARGSQPITGF